MKLLHVTQKSSRNFKWKIFFKILLNILPDILNRFNKRLNKTQRKFIILEHINSCIENFLIEQLEEVVIILFVLFKICNFNLLQKTKVVVAKPTLLLFSKFRNRVA